MPPQIAAFFAKYGLKLAIGVVVIALLTAGVIVAKHFIDKSFEVAEESGGVKAENKGHETTLDQLGKAHEAGDKVRNDVGSAAYDQCLRDSAPGYERSCDRYKPVQPVPGGPEAPHPGST